MCCNRCKKTGGVGNGAATLAPTGNPPVPPSYTGQAGVCSSGPVVGNAPFLTHPDDYASLPPIVSVPVVSRLGRRAPNNVYVYTPPAPGTVQVQSPKVGRY